MTGSVNISVRVSTYDRLKRHAHTGQSFDGVINELLDLVDQIQGTADQPLQKEPAHEST